MNEDYIPKRTDIYGDFEYSKFLDPDDKDYYTHMLSQFAGDAEELGYHEIADIADVFNEAIQMGSYRRLHRFLAFFIKSEFDMMEAQKN